MKKLIYFCIFCFFFICSCAVKNKTSSISKNNPLLNKIINTYTNKTESFDSLINNIVAYDVIYLSEKHDNPEHHKIQKQIIKALIKKGLKPVVGFEFFSFEDTFDLLNFIDAGKVKHPKKIQKMIETDLRKKLRWENQTDKMWKYYYDILTLLQKNNLMAAGIDLDTSFKKRILRKGIEGISLMEREQIFSTHWYDKAYKDYMLSIFKAVHCGIGNEKMQLRMYEVWKTRNDKMALSITYLNKYSKKNPVVIIVGAGHTNNELGVIKSVNVINKSIKQVNISFKEINTKPAKLEQYTKPLDLEGYKKVPVSDYLWFTQRVTYENPCDKFKK